MSNHFNYLQYAEPLFNEKQNRNQQFSSQTDYDKMKQSMSTNQPNQIKSRQNLYTLKLQSKALQLQKKLDHQNFQIQALTQQAQNYMKMCQSQKLLINSLNFDMMKQQYQEEIIHLKLQNERSKDFIITIKEQCNLIAKEQNDKLFKFRFQNQDLTKKIEQALTKKQQYFNKIAEKQKHIQKYKKTIEYQQQKIDQLRHIERKFIIALKQLQNLKLQSQTNFSTSK